MKTQIIAATTADELIDGATTTFSALVTFLLVVGVFAIAYRLVRTYIENDGRYQAAIDARTQDDIDRNGK